MNTDFHRRSVALALAAALVLPAVPFSSFADVGSSAVTDVIIAAGTTQQFTDEPVAEEDITAILNAGLAAESAINQQPWYLVAVSNHEILDKISGSGFAPGGSFSARPDGSAPEGTPSNSAPAEGRPSDGTPPEGKPDDGALPQTMSAIGSAKAGMGDSPTAIIIYMDPNTKSPNAEFDCGLAAQNMYLAAVSLGYGAKIVSSPTMSLNGENHDSFCQLLGVDTSMQAVAVLLIGKPAADAASGASVRSSIDEKASIIN